MDAVKCKLCGGNHPLGGPHVWDEKPVAAARPKAEPKQPPKVAPPTQPTEKRGRGRPKTGFDKKAYQRELMRERRAADKAKREADE